MIRADFHAPNRHEGGERKKYTSSQEVVHVRRQRRHFPDQPKNGTNARGGARHVRLKPGPIASVIERQWELPISKCSGSSSD